MPSRKAALWSGSEALFSVRALDSAAKGTKKRKTYFTMSKQYNKEIKRRRRSAYLKRKKEVAHKAAKAKK
jgi:hypothetical protein